VCKYRDRKIFWGTKPPVSFLQKGVRTAIIEADASGGERKKIGRRTPYQQQGMKTNSEEQLKKKTKEIEGKER